MYLGFEQINFLIIFIYDQSEDKKTSFADNKRTNESSNSDGEFCTPGGLKHTRVLEENKYQKDCSFKVETVSSQFKIIPIYFLNLHYGGLFWSFVDLFAQKVISLSPETYLA